MTVGTGPPDEVQEMLTLPPSKTVTVALVPAAVLEFAKCDITIIMLVLIDIGIGISKLVLIIALFTVV